MTAPTSLLFVYNAQSGLIAGLFDSVHKAVSPNTYACSLCAITYGALMMRPEWRAWLTAQPWDAVFTYRGDFVPAHPAHSDVALPAIFRRDGTADLTLIVSAAELAAATDVAALIALIERALA